MTIDVTAAGKGRFKVTISEDGQGRPYTVSLDDDYYRGLSREDETKESFIRRSFGFLLARESKDSILSSFDLRIISRYFPEYEEIIGK